MKRNITAEARGMVYGLLLASIFWLALGAGSLVSLLLP